MANFWDYSVWGAFNVVAVLLAALIVANILKKAIPFLENSLVPTSVLGGLILLVIAGFYKLFTGDVMFDTAFFGGKGMETMEVITYHTLALGFIASSFKGSKGKLSKKRSVEIFNTGITTVATYLIQGIVGLAITIVAAKILKGFFSAAGILLPFGYGQGTGQAMNYGTIFENEFGFDGGKSFGLIVAAMGFLSACIGGVIHLNILKKRGKIVVKTKDAIVRNSEEIELENEIPMQGSMDKLTVQIAIVAITYFIAYIMMMILGNLIPGFKSVIYGFNFILGVLAASLVKWIISFLTKKKVIKKQYTNDFLMTRCSNFFFDIMVVAGIAAIRLGILGQYWGILLILGVVGLVLTYAYVRFATVKLFPDYTEEQFLAMYGMLTGTASTGTILLREVDGNFKTPAADNLVYQNFPAIVFGFPIMFLATLAPVKPMLTLIILIAFFIVLNVILFRSYIFKKKTK